MPFSITGNLNWRGLGVHTMGTRLEMRDTAAEAMAVARRFREDGYADVRITDIHTGRRYDEVGAEREVADVPRGPKGEKRPADVVGNAVHVMRIATGEAEEVQEPENPAAVLGRGAAARRGRRR